MIRDLVLKWVFSIYSTFRVKIYGYTSKIKIFKNFSLFESGDQDARSKTLLLSKVLLKTKKIQLKNCFTSLLQIITQSTTRGVLRRQIYYTSLFYVWICAVRIVNTKYRRRVAKRTTSTVYPLELRNYEGITIVTTVSHYHPSPTHYSSHFRYHHQL